MVQLLDNELAVVTGGASGIGRGIATELARHGADVIVADLIRRPREGGTPTHELVRQDFDVDGEYVECDVQNIDDVERLVDVAAKLGGPDIMVNNAGIHRLEDFLEVSEEEFDKMMNTNLKSVFFGTQRAAQRMIDNGISGRIINVSSLDGIRGTPHSVSYSVAKAGVKLLTYSTAAVLGPQGIRVNAIHPGLTETSLMKDDVPVFELDRETLTEDIPLEKVGQPADIGGAVVFLASELSSHVTGSSIVVDGGALNTSM